MREFDKRDEDMNWLVMIGGNGLRNGIEEFGIECMQVSLVTTTLGGVCLEGWEICI